MCNYKILSALLCVLFVCSPALAAVSLSQNGDQITISNNYISAVLDTNNGALTTVTASDGFEISRGLIYNKNTNLGFGTMFNGGGISYQIIKDTPQHAEVAVTTTAGGKTPSSVELRFILREGESGFYCYIIERLSGQEEVTFPQTRMGTSGRPDVFNHYRLEDNRYGLFPTGAEVAAGTSLKPGEARRLEDGSIHYTFITHHTEDKTRVYGLYGEHNGQHKGYWIITPDSESVQGGHAKQNLATHMSGEHAVIVRMIHGSHYGGGSAIFGAGETWSKFYGPFMVYYNSGNSADAVWNDAKAKAETERARFPYSWVDEPLYERDNRISVTGRLNITDGSSAANAWVGLVQEDNENKNWRRSSKGYQYWAQADSQGNFTLENVRANGSSYTLYAHVDGVMDEFKQTGVVITRSDTSLGTVNWAPVRFGKLIWQVGTANKSVTEFKQGDDLGHWGLWLDFPTDFPTGVNYIVGQSNPAEDWNYAHCTTGWVEPVTGPQTLSVPDWNIEFDMANAPEENQQAFVSIDIVGWYLPSHLSVLVNGTEVEQVVASHSAEAMGRSAHYGYAM